MGRRQRQGGEDLATEQGGRRGPGGIEAEESCLILADAQGIIEEARRILRQKAPLHFGRQQRFGVAGRGLVGQLFVCQRAVEAVMIGPLQQHRDHRDAGI